MYNLGGGGEDVELYMLSCVPVCQQALAGRAAKRDEWSGIHCRQGRYD